MRKKCIYYAHIYSHIAYVNTIWGNSVTSKQKKIETIQKYCIRAIQNKPRNYPTDILFNNLEIIKFTEIQKFELCKLAHSLKEQLLPEPLIKLFNTHGKKTHTIIQLDTRTYQILKDIKVMNIIKTSYVKV